MRTVDPVTQCEIVRNPRINTTMHYILAMASYSGMTFPLLNMKVGKGEMYYVALSKAEQKLPYETKCDLRKVRAHLKYMDSLSDLRKVLKYKFR